MLTALGKWTELGTHVRGAVRNGVSELEIREALLHATFVHPFLFVFVNLIGMDHDANCCSIYCGMPAGLEAFRVADRVLNEMEQKGEMKRE
jgi:4-carboxymuconolactone decarboxylase